MGHGDYGSSSKASRASEEYFLLELVEVRAVSSVNVRGMEGHTLGSSGWEPL